MATRWRNYGFRQVKRMDGRPMKLRGVTYGRRPRHHRFFKKQHMDTGGQINRGHSLIARKVLTPAQNIILTKTTGDVSSFGRVDTQGNYVGFYGFTLTDTATQLTSVRDTYQLAKIKKARLIVKLTAAEGSCTDANNINNESIFCKIAPWKNIEPQYQSFLEASDKWNVDAVNGIMGMKYRILNGPDTELMNDCYWPVNIQELENNSTTGIGTGVKNQWFSTNVANTVNNGFILTLQSLSSCIPKVTVYFEYTWLFKNPRLLNFYVSGVNK